MLSHKIYSYIILIVLAFSAGIDQAQAHRQDTSASNDGGPITVYTIDIPGLIGNDQDNKYNLLFQRIGQMIDREIVVQAMPGRRLVRVFEENENICVFPEYQATSGPETIFTDAFNVVRVYFVSLKNKPLPTAETISDYSFATVMGYDYSFVDIDSVRERLRVANERQSLNLLLRDRVEAIVSYFPDLPLIWTPYEQERLHYDQTKSLYNGPERLGCKNTPNMQQFIVKFNNALAQLVKTGELEKILSPFYYGLK